MRTAVDTAERWAFAERYRRASDWLFAGSVPSWIYAVLRIGVATIFLVRHSDWLRPWLELEHHRFVHGLMFADSSAAAPELRSPLVPGLWLGPRALEILVYLRTGLALTLLLGVRARTSALLLFAVSYLIFLADRYRYYHHLQLLYLSVGWLALAPTGAAFSLERGLSLLACRLGWSQREPAVTPQSPLWPLQLIRAQVIAVYLAAGVSKLESSWLAGDALKRLEQLDILTGTMWTMVREHVGYAEIARLACAAEFVLPVLLCLPATRRAAIVLGWAFHAGISATMPVYTFGVQLGVLLLAFWPRARAP
jgi:hypothetical protein